MEASNKQQSDTIIIDDIWFHLSNYIAPEDVKRYSLICSQSANSINSRTFWFNIYRRYCEDTANSNESCLLKLPEFLQMKHLKHCNKKELRQRVIQTLFCRYSPLKVRLETPYSLDTLVGRSYVATWYKEKVGIYTRFLLLELIFPLTKKQKYGKKWGRCVFGNMECELEQDYDGIRGLHIRCDRFIPFPYDVFDKNATSPFCLTAVRELLSTQMALINLELDFISSNGDQTVTVKFTNIQQFKVIPWWHPKFRQC